MPTTKAYSQKQNQILCYTQSYEKDFRETLVVTAYNLTGWFSISSMKN